MRLNVTESMARNMAELEDGYSVTAGHLDTEAFFKEVELRAVEPAHREAYVGVLSCLISLARRAAGLTREQLATQADVDTMEVFQIEEEVAIVPEPRVVSRIARALKLPPGKLQQLAGHVTVLDPQVSTAAYRFAASSGSMQPLSEEQRSALQEFVKALSEG
jgi:transcriptional regulator with XRE-family HTH domain